MSDCQAGHDTHDRLLVDTQLGKLHVYDWDKYKDFQGYCTGQDDVSRTLINTGVWEPIESSLVAEILEKGNKNKLIIDIGAHIGWYSLMAAKLGYRVRAIESNQENCEVLMKNMELHNIPLTQVKLWKLWMDANARPVRFQDTLLVKCDIEGNEKYALTLCQDLFARRKAEYILFEISPVFNDSYPSVVRTITEYGYTPYFAGKKISELKKFDHEWNFGQTNLLFVRQS